MSRFWSGDGNDPTEECHTRSAFWASFGGQGISPIRIQSGMAESRGYLFECYQLWDTEARHAYHPQDGSSESSRMLPWLAQSLRQQPSHLSWSTTNRLYSSRCMVVHLLSLQGAQVQNRCVLEMGDVIIATVDIWKYPCSIMFQRYVKDIHLNFTCCAQNEVQRGIYARHLVIGMIQFEVVQSMPQMLINAHFCFLAKWLSLWKVVCLQKSKPWIPLFWVLVMRVVQSSCFAICSPSHIIHTNYLPMSLCLGWIRGTCHIRLLGVYSFFIRSIFRWWHTKYHGYRSITSGLAHRWPFSCTNWCQTTMARVHPGLQQEIYCQGIIHNSSILGNRVDPKTHVSSRHTMSSTRSRTIHVSSKCWP